MKEKLRQAWERAWSVTRDVLSIGAALALLFLFFGAVLLLSIGIEILKFVFVQPTEKLLSLTSSFPFRTASGSEEPSPNRLSTSTRVHVRDKGFWVYCLVVALVFLTVWMKSLTVATVILGAILLLGLMRFLITRAVGISHRHGLPFLHHKHS